MGVNRAIISDFQIPKTAADWELLGLRLVALIKQVPVKYWQLALQVLLVFSIAISLARLFWLLVPTPTLPPAAVAVPVASQQQTGAGGSSVDINQVKGLSVFGKAAPAATKDAPVSVNQAVDTRLNLVLLGVMASSDENQGKAIISSGDKSDMYAVGESLPAGAGVVLAKVFSDRVIINNNGQAESLWLYSSDPNAKVGQQSSAPAIEQANETSAQSHRTRRSNRTWAPDVQGGESPEMQSPQPAHDAAMQDAAKTLSDVVAMSIYRENSQVVGYKIRPGRDGEKFRSLGLQADDIVTSVNGMPLSNPSKIMEIYKNMGGATSASLEIKRGGTVMTIDVVL